LASGAGPRSGVVPDLKNLTTGSQAPVLGSQGGAGTTTSLPDRTTRPVEWLHHDVVHPSHSVVSLLQRSNFYAAACPRQPAS